MEADDAEAIAGEEPEGMIAKLAIVSDDSMVKVFYNKNIRTQGVAEEMLFCVRDVAAYIGDANYVRALKKYKSDATEETGEYLLTVPAYDSVGCVRNMMFFTENGLYRYLLRSNLKKAVEFQTYVYNLLKKERGRILAEAIEKASVRARELESINADLLTGNANLRQALERRSKLRRRISSRIEKPVILGCLYFIGKERGAGNQGAMPIKVGYAQNVRTRLSAFQVARLAKLVVHRTIVVTDPRVTEAHVHEHFRAKHIKGEWFSLTKEDIHAYKIQ